MKKEMKTTKEFGALIKASKAAGEKGDCAVKAIALTTGVPYENVLGLVNGLGREKGHGTPLPIMRTALKELGFKITKVPCEKFISKYPKSKQNKKVVTPYQPARFPAAWKDGKNYILISPKHAAAVLDGVTHDWSNNRSLQCDTVWLITKK